MDKVFEFITDLKNRLTSPFLLSFLISWLIWNWRIWVGLFWYDSKELYTFYPSVWLFIRVQVDWWISFWVPLFSAIVYTLSFPLINTVVTWYNSKVISIREETNLQILGTVHMPYEIFNDVENELEQKKKDLQKTINSLSATKIKNEEYLKEINELRTTVINKDGAIKNMIEIHSAEKEKLQNAIIESETTLRQVKASHEQELLQLDDLSVIDGIWNFSKNGGKEKYRVVIHRDSMLFVNDNDPFDKHNFFIKVFYYNYRKGLVVFVRRRDKESIINELSVRTENGRIVRLDGAENFEPVVYTRAPATQIHYGGDVSPI